MKKQNVIGRDISYKLRIVFLSITFMCFFVNPSKAQEITAIDFNGEVIGKVIPDGKVVSLENKLIGNINADSLISNFEGELIGGIVPQGIAIGNDNKFLGKVTSDGFVRTASGKTAGRVLTTGLVINDFFDVIGSVLFPGLVYSDTGETVGRLIGDGSYINLQGQKIGFVTSDGYAYKQVGNEYILDGKLISSKMVISNMGDFIGSVSPNGEVTDFDSKVIGKIKANGYVYDSNDEVIGSSVKSGYAFDLQGKYLGFVTYNGEVMNKEELVGRVLTNGKIVDLSSNIIGSFEDFSSTFVNNNGEYLGRLLPNGVVAKSNTAIGKIGANGIVVDDSKAIIGTIIKTGPVFDYRGTIIGHSLKNGSVISISGTLIGKMKNNIAFDNRGKIIGAVNSGTISIDFNNSIIGMSDINSLVIKGEEKNTVSPFGYVFSSEGNVIGANFAMDSMYSLFGQEVAGLYPNGKVLNKNNEFTGVLTSSGFHIDEKNRILGKIYPSKYIAGMSGNKLGDMSYSNTVFSKKNTVIGKRLFDNSVVSSTLAVATYYNKIGQAYDSELVLSVRGNLLGYASHEGVVKDFSGYIIGQVMDRGVVLDNNGDFIGEISSYGVGITDSCEFLGVITPKGEVRNLRDTYVGKALLNGQIVSDSGVYLGYTPKSSSLINDSGFVIGVSSMDGTVVNSAGEKLGCVDKNGVLKSSDKMTIAKVTSSDYVMDFSGSIMARNSMSGSLIDDSNETVGYVQSSDSANLTTGIPVGNLFKYKYAFDERNNLIGIVLANSKVISLKDKKEIGYVDFYGRVILDADEETTGYALYDLYVYDENQQAVGYISFDGNISSFMGQSIGRINKGFVVDSLGKVIARGNRDYIIRNETYVPLGNLSLKGNLVDFKGESLGVLYTDDGSIKNSSSTTIATANELQYYGKKQSSTPVYNQSGDIVGYAKDDGSVVNEDGKTIAILNNEGLAISANGDIIGGVGANWYERAKQVGTRTEYDLPQVGIIDNKVKEQSRKSLAIALTPDGEFLGYIQNDGRVTDNDGKYIGRKMPDGLIIDDDGGLIGVEETATPDSNGIFIPTGTFGNGGAYGTGTGAGSNLGPGGGYGPGERYDPQRAAALNVAQGQRRQNMQVGKISTKVKKSSFDGMQEDWNEQGVNKTLSSWRVDLSEMILADKPIPAVLSRSIDSSNPTPVTAYVERNVYAEVGRNIIIPAGSRVIGNLGGGMTASTEATSQSAKVSITWERLIRPDGSIFTFAGITGDAQGRGGALGYLDQQLFKKYTLPVMTTVLTSGTAYMMAGNSSSSSSGDTTPKQQAADDARQNFLDSMNSIFNQILEDKTNIKPLTYVPAGTRVIIYPNVDLWLRTARRDELEADENLQAKDILIDDKASTNERKSKELTKKAENATGVSGTSGSGDVAYQYDENDSTYEKPSLLSDKKSTQNRKNKAATGATPPPPPPSSSTTPAPSKTPPPSSSSGNSSGVPQLF